MSLYVGGEGVVGGNSKGEDSFAGTLAADLAIVGVGDDIVCGFVVGGLGCEKQARSGDQNLPEIWAGDKSSSSLERISMTPSFTFVLTITAF